MLSSAQQCPWTAETASLFTATVPLIGGRVTELKCSGTEYETLHPPASNSVTLMTLEKAKFKCTLRSSLHLCCEWLCPVTLLCPYPACHSGVHDGPASQKPFKTGKVNSKHNTHMRGGDAFVSHHFVCSTTLKKTEALKTAGCPSSAPIR